MYYLPHNKNLKQFSRNLRNNSTLSEVLLWKQLRAGSIRGYKFNRQKPLDNYIVDFYCKKLSLVIEVDGEYHFEGEMRIRDKERQRVLESIGLKFLRFENIDVKMNILFMIRVLEDFVDDWEQQNPAVPR